MKREISFRVWDKGGEIWLTYPVIALSGILYVIADGKMSEISKPEDIIIMQYTGLKDKNGKKIFEGDVIEYRENRNTIFRQEIGWNEQFGCWTLPSKSSDSKNITPQNHIDSDWEIIGNIYEDPKLI